MDTMIVEKDTAAFLEAGAKTSGPPIYKLPLPEARGLFNRMQAGPTHKMEADIEDRIIPYKHNLSIRIVRPHGNKHVLPATMYFHGGGWVFGGKDSHDRLIREIANGATCVVIFVSYTPAPEGQYPCQIEEAYAATKWVAENAKEIHVDPSKLAVMGDSAGGNMAIAVTLLAKEHKTPHIIFQILFYPVTDTVFNTESYKIFKNGPWPTLEATQWVVNQYAPDPSKWSDPKISPNQAPIELLQGLPSALVITDENDVLRDEGESYAKKLMQAGVTVTAVRYIGTIHDFVMLNALAHTPAAKGAIAQACTSLKAAFGN